MRSVAGEGSVNKFNTWVVALPLYLATHSTFLLKWERRGPGDRRDPCAAAVARTPSGYNRR